MGRSADQAHRAAVALQHGAQRVTLGPYASYSMMTDPKHLCFVLSRYKFCAKLLHGQPRVLEVGCGDAIGLPLVAQSVGHVFATDQDATIVDDNLQRMGFLRNCTFLRFDPTRGPFQEAGGALDAVYLLDVIEHVEPSLEASLMDNLAASVRRGGVCIVGTPNAEAAKHASPQSQEGHINLKSHAGLLTLMQRRFETSFLFSMNDEVVHTGFYPMAHYFVAVGVGPTIRQA